VDEGSFRGAGVESQGGLIRLDGVWCAPEALQQVGSGDVEGGPAGELGVVGDGVEDDHPGRRSFGHGHRDGPVGFVTGLGS
jgi:hypothetical protein